MMFFWIFLVAAAVILLMAYTRGGTKFTSFLKPEKENPVDTLKRRFAEGEISNEEYEERKEALEEDGMFKP